MKRVVCQFIRGTNDGGAETIVKDYSTLLDKDLFSVFLVTLYDDKNTSISKTLHTKGIQIIPIYKNWNWFTRAFNKLCGRIYVPLILYRILRANSVDIMHIHMAMLKYVSPISNLLKGIKIFYTCHSLPNIYFSGRNDVERKCAEKLIKNNALQIIALHRNMASEINTIFNIDNTLVLNNGVDFERFKNTSISRDEMRKELSITPDTFLLGHVGRFSYPKNHDLIIDIFCKLKEQKHNSKLLLVGTGELLPKIINVIKEKRIADDVIILQNRTDIPELMNCMDTFIFPSRYEGLGIVLVEAQISGLKCVVSDQVPTSSFITNNVKVVQLDDPIEKWVDAIINDCAGKKYSSMESYDMKNVVLELQKLYLGE